MAGRSFAWRPWDPPWLVALTAALAAALAMALLASWLPAGKPFCGPGCIDSRLAALTAVDGTLPRESVGRARALVRLQLGYSPFDAAAWLRLAAVEAAEGGDRLTPAAQAALDRSYRFTPVDLRIARWRLRFAFEHWGELGPSLRGSAEAELRSLLSDRHNYDALRGLATEIVSPGGRLAFALLFGQIPPP